MPRHVVFLAVLAVLPAVAFAQVTLRRAPAQEAEPPRQMSFMGFVVASAFAAGAVGACEAPSAVVMRDCVERVIPDWARLSGQPTPDPNQVAAVPAIWRDAFDKARARQANVPPIPCDEVLRRARAMSMWTVCPSPWD